MHQGRNRAKWAGLCQLHVFLFLFDVILYYPPIQKLSPTRVPIIGQPGALSAYVEMAHLVPMLRMAHLVPMLRALGSEVEVAHVGPMRDLAATARRTKED